MTRKWKVRENMRARGRAVVRALAYHQCGPGSNPGVLAICGLSLLLVLSLAPRGFSPGTPVFPSPQKPTFPNSNSTRNQVDEEPLCGCATCKSLFILFLIWARDLGKGGRDVGAWNRLVPCEPSIRSNSLAGRKYVRCGVQIQFLVMRSLSCRQ